MQRIHLMLLLPFMAMAQTPITLNNSNMPSSGDTLRYTNVSAASVGNYTQTGANFSWDFSNVVSLTEGLRSFRSPLSTPYALFFASFTGAAEKLPDLPSVGTFSFSDFYLFYRKPTSPVNAYLADGMGITISGIPLPSFYTDKDELYYFPMTYPQRDSSTFRFSTPNSTVLPIRYIRQGYRITEVDGWGTVATPYGTENCLRIVTTEYGVDTIKNSFVPIPFGIPNYVRSYQWLSLSSKIPYFEVSGSLMGGNFVPTTYRYRGYKKVIPNPVGLDEKSMVIQARLVPNPASGKLFIEGFESGRVEVADLSGRIVLSVMVARGEEASIDVSGLKPGVYEVRLETAGFGQALKLIKE